MDKDDGYRLLAGKCLTICNAIAQACPEFTLVRGHYFCPIWNKDRAHWWLQSSDGVIFDPTREQFPSCGQGTYTPFDGFIECSECGKKVLEKDADIEGKYAFCSYTCNGRFVGAF